MRLAEAAAIRQARQAMTDRAHLLHKAEQKAMRDAKKDAQTRRSRVHEAVRRAEQVELEAAKKEANKAAPSLQRLSHPYPKAGVNEEVSMLKTLAGGGDLTHDEIHVLAGMSIRHHETTRRYLFLSHPDVVLIVVTEY